MTSDSPNILKLTRDFLDYWGLRDRESLAAEPDAIVAGLDAATEGASRPAWRQGRTLPSVMMSCPDCGAGLDDVPVGEPCPTCGGTRRDAVAFAQSATVKVEAFMPTIIVGYDEHRPWHEKWRDVQDGLEQIENAYAATESDGYYGNERVRRVVEGFFKDCRELADWLWQDHQSTGLDKSIVMAAVMSDPDLRVADGFAQTIKHHTRRATKLNPDPITARIKDIGVGPSGGSVFIDWWRPSGAHGMEDALDLARRCVNAWRRFLTGRGLEV